MNSKRTNFNFPISHKISISDPWLLGLIEGDGFFYLDRSGMEPIFSISQNDTQLSLIENIKNYLEINLGFDKYSMFKLDNSSIISTIKGKARKNSKPSAELIIKNVNVLTHYLIPYLDKMTFISKKGKDFKDFKIICQAVYKGSYRTEEIKSLIVRLSYTMNNYRLSSSSKKLDDDDEKKDNFSDQSIEKIINAEPTIRHLKDGRQLDIITGKPIYRRLTNCVFEIINENNDILLASTLNDAAEILGVEFRTVARHLGSETMSSNGSYATINNSKVRRVPVFYG